MNLPIETDKTYVTRKGMRVYVKDYHYVASDIMAGYGEDGIYHHFRRDSGKSHVCIGYNGSPPMNWPQLDIVSEDLGLTDLKEECLAYERHSDEQRQFWESVRELPNGYETYRQWCRKHRPPGPLRPGMKESDYDKVGMT